MFTRTRKARVLAAVLGIAALAVAAGGWWVSAASGGASHVANAATTVTTVGDPLQTVTPYQLSQLGVTLGPRPAFPAAVTAAQADATARKEAPFGGDPILETVYATCEQPAGMEPCWVISTQPTGPMPNLGGFGCVGGACTAAPGINPTATVELVWVNAQTGQMTDAMDISAPPTAPSAAGAGGGRS